VFSRTITRSTSAKRVHVEALPQADVDGAEAASDGSRDRTLQGDAVRADRLQRRLRERVAAVLVHDFLARGLHVPVELDAGRLEDAACRLGELGAGSVAGYQRYAMGHRRGRTLPQARRVSVRVRSSLMDAFTHGLEVPEPDGEAGSSA
jgi:hypothetical protein